MIGFCPSPCNCSNEHVLLRTPSGTSWLTSIPLCLHFPLYFFSFVFYRPLNSTLHLSLCYVSNLISSTHFYFTFFPWKPKLTRFTVPGSSYIPFQGFTWTLNVKILVYPWLCVVWIYHVTIRLKKPVILMWQVVWWYCVLKFRCTP